MPNVDMDRAMFVAVEEELVPIFLEDLRHGQSLPNEHDRDEPFVERSRSAAGRVGSGSRPGSPSVKIGFHFHPLPPASGWGRNDERVCPSLRQSQP
jgi:hypothetical protein